jgi:hypothetical protein
VFDYLALTAFVWALVFIVWVIVACGVNLTLAYLTDFRVDWPVWLGYVVAAGLIYLLLTVVHTGSSRDFNPWP